MSTPTRTSTGAHIGVDFGTTNSGAAVSDGQQVRVLPIDPQSSDPTVMRSMLYLTREHQVSVGRAAMEAYYEQNVGRPSKMTRQWVGEIEVTGGDMYYVRDVYVMVDEWSPGRLLRSLKSSLATSYEGTTIFGRYYALEELIALYLRAIRQRAQAELGQTVESVVLGRPVNYVGSEVTDDDLLSESVEKRQDAKNERARERLRQAAHMAGFREVSFELEPVAAALHYELTVGKPQNIVVFDFGGGTLDITVMHVGGGGEPRIFAAGGVGIAGDVFDTRIVEGMLLEHFGRGSTYGENQEPFPDHYTDALANWQTVLELNRPETMRFLRWAQITGSHPARVRALASLLANNYIAHLFDEVEQNKIVLSDRRFTAIRLTGDDISVWQPLSRSQFELLIDAEAKRIQSCLLDTLQRSGLALHEIDAVVRTGGSAQIPLFVDMLGQLFGPEKVILSSVFSSVTAGLAIQAGRRAGAAQCRSR